MKKLLFSLVAAAACGAVSAAVEDFSSYTLGAEFSAATNTAGEVDNDNPGNWTINMSENTDLEMLITNNVADTDTGNYLQINTGNTPLWRTFKPVKSVANATSGVPQAMTIDDGTVVSSKVKLTACTEWPELESFWGEKLALFYYVPEDAAAAELNSEGLYAVGGTWINKEGSDPVFTNKAYKLVVPAAALDGTTCAITNRYGWAKIDIKAYTNVLSTASSYSGFIVAVNDNLVTVDVSKSEDDYIGLGEQRKLSNAADARFDAKQLILAAATGQFAGLGFQGEGGIDDVDLAAEEINDMKDQAQMTVSIVGVAELKEVTGGTLDDGKVTFIPGATVTFKVDSTADIVKVTYSGTNKLEYNSDTKVYSVVAEAEATITVSASDAAFQIGDDETGKKYATLADALKDLKSGDTLKLLAPLTMTGENNLSFDKAIEVTLDLNGQTISAETEYVIYNTAATLNIVDNFTGTMGTVDGAIANEATLTLVKGFYNGAINSEEGLTLGADARFASAAKDSVEEPEGKDWAADGDYFKLVDEAGDAPTVDDENATITPDGQGNYVVETEAESLEINLPENFDKKVVIPATVNSVSGVAIGQLKVMATVTVGETTQSFDIAGVLKIEGGKLVLDETKAKPALAEEDPLVVGDTTAVSVKTIPGLKYSLVYDSDLSFESDAKGETAAVPATTTSMTLTDDSESKPTKRFYKVKVTK